MMSFEALFVLVLCSCTASLAVSSAVVALDISCCRQHAESELGCLAETGSTCVWLSSDDQIASAYVGQCFALGFVECKMKNIEACCGACPPAPGPDDPTTTTTTTSTPIISSVCGPAPTLAATDEPSPAPTAEPTANPTPLTCDICPLSESGGLVADAVETHCYYFQGFPCTISGDPHFQMFNGDKHDFQGQPTAYSEGVLRNQFYYVKTCAGSEAEDMPFSIIGTHYPFLGKQATGVDYVVLELHESSQDSYFVYISSSIAFWAEASENATSNYDDTVAANGPVAGNSALTSLVPSTTVGIGSRFTVEFTQISETDVTIVLTVDTTNHILINMEGDLQEDGGRRRVHFVEIEQAAAYKCFSCGLCGNYKTLPTQSETSDTAQLEGCDGTMFAVLDGIDEDIPEGFDLYGLTWERYYADNICGVYDITDNVGDFVWIDSCDKSVVRDVEQACRAARKAHKVCCATIEEWVCDNMEDDCVFDVCTVIGTDLTLVDDAVYELLSAQLEFMCSEPGIGTKFNRDRLNTMAPRPTRSPTTARPSKAPVTSRPTKAPVTPRPTKAPVTPKPSKAPVTPRPSKAPVTPKPSKSPVSPKAKKTARPTRPMTGSQQQVILAHVMNGNVEESTNGASSGFSDLIQSTLVGSLVLCGCLGYSILRCSRSKQDAYKPISDPAIRV